MKNEITLSGLQPSQFQQDVNGKETRLCVLTNKAGAELTILNYGARIVSLMIPDRNKKMIDVVTGFGSIADYLGPEDRYFGAVCGRYANRIAKGRFTLDGVVYDQLATNNGPNHLHGGLTGFNSVVWDMEQTDKQTVILRYTSADGEEGYPGTLKVTLLYNLSNNNDVSILYTAETDKPTVVNLTNHSFFNLTGAGEPTLDYHKLLINADYYLPTDHTAIPYGEKAPVEGTPMDFRIRKMIGDHINENFEQLVFGNGYDHTYIINNMDNKNNTKLSFCASCASLLTGIVMDVFTTEPGVQLYTGNYMNGLSNGKNGQRYPRRSAFCLETQHFPDSPNRPEYPSVILRPGEEFASSTMYSFTTV